MGVTVFHSLTATTPDNTQYEIRPSHWNSNHAVSLSIAGSDLSNAFSNSPTVTFGTSAGLMTASVNTNYAVTNITTNNIATSQSSLFLLTSQSSLFQQTSATSAITSAAFASSNSSLLVATSNSSLFQQTSATSAITSAALHTSQSSLFQQTSATSAITSAAFPSAQTTKFAGTGTTFAGTNISATVGLNSNGLALSLSGQSGGGGGGGIAAAAGTQTATSGTVVFSNSNGITFGMSNSSVITASYTVPTVPTAYVSSVNGSSGAISLNVGSSLSASTNGSSITFGLASNITTALQSAGAYLTTAAQSSASNVSVVIAGTAPGGGTASLSGGVSFSNANGVSFYTSAGNAVVASYTVPTVPTSYVSQVNGSSGAVSVAGTGSAFTNLTATYNTAGLSLSAPGTSSLSGTGALSISTTGSTISIGVPVVSMGISGGNTSGNTGTVSNQLVLAGGNNITLSGSTNAGGMTVTISANTAAAANLSVSAGTTSGAFGGLTFANSNNVTFGLNNGTITASAPSGGGGGIAAAAGTQTATSGTVLFNNANGITFGMSNSSVITASHNGLTTAAQSSASNVSLILAGTAPGGGTASLSGGVSFSNANGISFYTSAGNAVVASYTVPTVPTAYVSSVNGSSGAISLNVGSSLSASTNGSSVTFGLASNITTALQSANANYLTTQSAQAFSASGGSSTFQTLNFANSNGVTFSNSGGSVIASYTVPTVPTSYVSQVNGSSGAVSVAGTGSAFTNLTATYNTAGLSISAPGTSSISGTGALSISTTGATISIGVPVVSMGISGGNTAGNTGTVSNQIVFAGGNNITVSGSTNAGGMTVTLSGPNAAGAQTGISGIIAGTQTQTSGTVSFANSNGITFGMSNSSIITASHNGLTTAAQSSASNVSLVIAGTAPGGGTASLSGGVSFSNANGVSFYTSAGNAVVASYTVPTVPTAYVSSVNGSSGAISLNVGSSLSASTNGSSITFGLASNITTALQSAGAYLTTAAQSSASNVSLIIAGTAPGGGTASLSGGVSFSNANGVSFYTSAGNAVVASYTVPAVPTAYVSSVNGSSGAISLNVGSSLSASTNGSSITFGLASNITTALQSANANYLTSQSNQAFSASGGSSAFQTLNFANSNGLTFSNSGGSVIASYTVPTQTNQTVGFYASSQTTGQSSSSTFDARSLSFVGAGGVSIGASNGSIIFSGATGGGGGGVAFANSQTTYTSGTVSLREGGGAITIASNTGQRIDISVPGTSSILGVSGMAISSTSNSIYIYNDFNKTWEVAPAFSGVVVYSTASASTLHFMPLFPQDNYTFSGVQMLGSITTASATNASYAASHTISYALYSVDQTGTTMSRLGSSSMAILMSASSNAQGAFTISYSNSSVTSSSLGLGLFSAFQGQKYMNFLFASSLQDGGAYALGVGYSSTSTNASPLSPVSFNQVRYMSNISAFGILDGTNVSATANSFLPDGLPFVYSATSGGWPTTIGFSERRQIPTYQFPYVMFRGT